MLEKIKVVSVPDRRHNIRTNETWPWLLWFLQKVPAASGCCCHVEVTNFQASTIFLSSRRHLIHLSCVFCTAGCRAERWPTTWGWVWHIQTWGSATACFVTTPGLLSIIKRHCGWLSWCRCAFGSTSFFVIFQK